MTFPRKLTVFLSLLLATGFGQDVDELIQFEEDPEEGNRPQDHGEPQEEDRIVLNDLTKPGWRQALEIYDTNRDGKLTGDELLMALPVIQTLMEDKEESTSWWEGLILSLTPYMGVLAAALIGGLVFIFALRRVIRASDDSIRHRNEQAIKNQRKRQQWLDSLEGRKQSPEGESDEDRSMIKLQKRKPESMHNLVTSKMARYQHLSAVRRLPGNHSNQSDTAGNLDSMNIYQQLLPDEDEIAENSTDEIKIGNTRKRRPNVVVDEKQQKVAKDGAAEILEVKVSSDADALDDVSDTLNNEAKNASETQKFDAESIDSVSETNKDFLEGELNPEMRMTAILTTLSHVLDCKVVTSAGKRTTFTFQDKTLKVNVLQLPNQLDDVPIKITAIVEVMTVRQLNKVKLAAGCFDRAAENLGLSGDSVVQEVCSVLAEYFTNMIIKEIDKEEETWDDDDLWVGNDADTESAGQTSGRGTFVHKSVDILHRIGGGYDDPDDISPALLNKLLQHRSAHNFLSTLLQYAGKQLRSVRRMDEMLLREGRTLNALDILLSNPLCGGLLGRVLEEELEEAANGLGNFFERTSIFGSLLSLTTVPAYHKGSYAIKSLSATAFTELRGFPKCTESDLRLLESTIQLALQRCQNIVFTALKKVLTNKTTREVALAWLAAAINLNEIRTNWTPEPDSQESIGCNDGFMLNFCTVLIEFFLPAVTSPELLTKVDLGYSASDACRLNFSFEICLAGGQIVSENSGDKKIGTLDDNLQGKFNFLTECFHLSQRALSIGVIPAISHYNRLHRRFSQQLELVKGTPQEEGVQRLHTLLALMWDASLTNPELVRKVSQFYLSQSQLLLTLIDRAIEEDGVNPKKKLLSRIPEFCVKDMAVWFGFVARHAVFVHKDVLSGLSLSPFVDCCVVLLAHPELMPGPLPASKVVSALGAFVLSSKKQGRGWGNDVHSDLALMVLACPSVREGLGGALVRTYVSVNVVEGLDVDKEEFDKYTTRAEITLLIRTLWDQVDTRASILDLANTKLFQDFLGSTLDTLLYMLHDALGRMANVRKMEAAKDDAEEWAKLSPVEQRDKENFLRAESTVGVGFMRQANQTLGFLELLTKSEEVAKCFTRPPLNQRAASAISGFLESLCGPNCKDLKVKNMEKYNFDPQSLVFQIVSVILRIAEQDVSQSESFVVSMAADPDFSPPALEKALSVLSRTQLAQPAELETFAKLIDTMKAMHRISKVNEAACTRADNSTQWQEAASALTIDVESLMKEYQSALSSLRFGATDLQESHSFQANAQDSDPGAAKVKALMKEMKQLRSNLPVHPDAAIIVRQDEERIDLMRALVTGPVDTPYSRGCFLFDVYFPNNYPNIPPLLKIITTGNGTVRFNPNLYSDGKVCLSLLGTWHAGDASEKWIPSKSSLYQVLVSIQSLILIPDPMFNEPGYEGVRGTTEGDARSKAYNRKLRLWTVRHAMLGQLRSPPQGFEDLIKQHFTIQKDAVLKQCSDWLKDCDDADEEKRLRSVVNSLREELTKLGDDKPVKYELDDDDDLYS